MTGKGAKAKLQEVSPYAGNLFYKLYLEMLESDDPVSTLAGLLENRPEGLEYDDFELALDELGANAVVPTMRIMWDVVSMLLARNPDAGEFYDGVWRFISTSELLCDDASHAATIAALLGDGRLPYCKYDLVTLDDDEFDARYQGVYPLIAESQRVLNRVFSQKTEEASALLSILDRAGSDLVDRSVLLSAWLEIARSEAE